MLGGVGVGSRWLGDRSVARLAFFVTAISPNTVLTRILVRLLAVTARGIIAGSSGILARGGDEAILPRFTLDLLGSQVRELFGCRDVRGLLRETLGEDNINLLKRAALGLGEEEVDNGDEEGVHDSEEEG